MDCTIVTRSLNPKLTAMAHSLVVDLGFKFKSIFDSSAGDYIRQCVYESDTKFVINLDEDAFVFNSLILMELLKYIDVNNIGFCGVPDGGVIHHRKHNPIVPNPFFNIFNCEILKKIPINNQLFTADLKSFTPVNLIKESIGLNYDNFEREYYHYFFNWLKNGATPLYLNANDHNDKLSSNIFSYDGTPFLTHTWFARLYKDHHKSRIDKVYDDCSTSRKYNIGIVAPCYDIPDVVKKDFLLQVEKLNIDLTYIIDFVDDDCMTNNNFNLSKSRNIGIKRLLNKCEVIVTCDVDLMIPNGLLEFTHHKCLQNKGLVFCYARYLDYRKWIILSNHDMLNIPASSTGLGAWNAMCPEEWIKSCGWNEDLHGWGFEDDEFHIRIKKLDIQRIFTNSFPLVHINHSKRTFSGFYGTQFRNIDVANSSSLNKNWLND